MITLDENHQYVIDGKHREGVSHYIERHKQQFPKEFIARKTAERDGRTVEEVLDEWELKGKLAREYGSAVHTAIELWVKYAVTPQNAHLKAIVEQYSKLFDRTKIKREIAVYDEELAGTVDELEITGEKKCILRDTKTNFDLYKKGKKLLPPYDYLTDSPIDVYTLQLNLYKRLLEYHGWTVEKMEIVQIAEEFNIITIKELWKI